MALAKRLLESTGFVGLSSLEAKRHAVTGEPVLTEINVRVPLNFGLGDASGVEASWRSYAALAGLPLDRQPEQRYGRKVAIPWLDARAVRTRMARGELSATGALRSYRGTRDFGVLNVRDPAPGIALASQALGDRAARRRTRRAAAAATRSPYSDLAPTA